jgi:hypothetical protein
MNNDISRCGFRNLRMFIIIVLARNTPDYLARETAVLQHLLLFILGKLLVRRRLARAFSDTFNNASSDFCFVSLPTMLSSFSPKVLANARLLFSSAPWQAAQFFS